MTDPDAEWSNALKDINYQKLSHNDPLIRKSAAQAIWRKGSKNDLQKVQNTLILEQDPRVVKWLAFTLAKIGDISSLEFLKIKQKIVENEDARDWIMVSRAILLEAINGKPDLRYIHQLLSSQSSDVRKKGTLLTWPIKILPETVEEKLIKQLNHEDARVRRWSLLSLGNSLNLPTFSLVRGGLFDSDYLVREWTECVLANIRDPQAYLFLVDRLQDDHPRVREWAIKALASYDMLDIPEMLISYFYKEPDELCREGTILALQKWYETPIVREFLLSVFKAEQSLIVLSALIDALQTSTLLRTNPQVIETMLDIESGVMDEAIRLQVGAALLYTCTNEELSQISGVLGSRKLRLLLDLLIEQRPDEGVLKFPRWKQTATSLASQRNVQFPLPTTLSISTPLIEETGYQRRNFLQKPIDIGVVIALKEEFREFIASIRPQPKFVITEEKETGENFYEFEFSTADGFSYTCVATLIGGMGPAKAAIKTERLLARYKPKTAVIIGIAAAVHKDVFVGDIVVARQIDGYIDSSKAVKSNSANKFDFELSGEVFHSSEVLVKAIANYEFKWQEAFQHWLQESFDNLCSLVPEPIRSELISSGIIREKSTIHEGHIASGPVVGATTYFTKWLLGRDRNYKALEMESVGLMEAATSRYNPPYTLVLRGVSDFGDHRKVDLDLLQDGVFRKLAMRNAVQLLFSLLRVGIFSRL